MLYGYARCSTDESKQDIQRQVRELRLRGVKTENIYLEYESGTKTDRNELDRMFANVQEGDTVIATEVSRITRSTKQLCDILEFAKDQKLCLIFGSFKVDCREELDPMTEGMLILIGVFAELERKIICHRVKSGIENARDKGKQIGRTRMTADKVPSIFFKHYPLYKAGKISKREFAKVCDISYPTVYRYIKIAESHMG